MSAKLFGELPAFRQKSSDGRLCDKSYAQFRKDVMSFGSALCKMGHEHSSIALCAGNSILWCAAYMAAAIYTAAAVPIDKELTGSDIIKAFQKSGSKVLVTDKKTYKKICSCGNDFPQGTVLIGTDFCGGDVLPAESLLEETSITEMPQKADDEISVLLFTSGTTGDAKAVALSQSSICFDISSVMKIVKINEGERALSLLPLHHTYECSITFLCCFYAGVTVCFGGGLREIYSDLKLFSPHALILVPLFIENFYKKLHYFSKETISEFFGGSLRLIVCGAAPLDPKYLEFFSSAGITALQGYGLTECSPIAMCSSDKDVIYSSVGKPLPGTLAKIINKDENGIGEICVKGKMLMLGYYEKEKSVIKSTDSDGWFHTGDLGKTDEDGNYYITGRLKNVIITANGKNVFPEELELKLTSYGEIDEALVYEGRDIRNDRAVCAKIVTHAERERIKEIIKEINLSNAPFKAIKDFEICRSLQKNAAHKIVRNN